MVRRKSSLQAARRLCVLESCMTNLRYYSGSSMPFVSSNVEDWWHRLTVTPGISKTQQIFFIFVFVYSHDLCQQGSGLLKSGSCQLSFLLLAFTLSQLSLADASRLLHETFVSKRQCLRYQQANQRWQIPARYGATLTSQNIF